MRGFMMNAMEMQFPMVPTVYEPKELRALVISDAHVNGKQLNSLGEWLRAKRPSYDVVLLLGNIANMVNKFRNDYYAENEAIRQLDDTIKFLGDCIEKPIFYIPGNTEPTGTYNFTVEIPDSVNLHKRAVQLDEGLAIIGLGGAMPIKKEDKEILEGYPYSSEEEFSKDLAACIEAATKTFGPTTSFLLLTHVGPEEAGTAEIYLGKDQVNGGCKGLAELLKSNKIIGHVHGHSALAEGLTKPFGPSIPVVNPGGLVAGRFGEISLKRGTDGIWKVGDVQLRNLN
eukprot:TRINITY_DN455_c0_g1_i1.p1 TRINITY_DN455_c0_g1~~TRINITY_DN455_c0_g1_i1.p1  ORF type:complete len:285 (-),score=111.38 TRINITY_DN455_c0_g1_i1:96-950(-)